MKRRLFALALALLLAVSLPVSALAGEWFIDGGDIIINATADGKQTVKAYLAEVSKEVGATVALKSFVRFETGEGIEKKEEDFAAEVAKQMQ